ncbi:hypothetical protein [Paludisphaera borealis]|uniref:Uncharacterized protein n=1 Tax=Paludisphaera borealis TaxID=1387353 RepID=A0A1U7CTK8_9BACT|nr:hypothetical protein [Paludisphaera borealis]APW62262.1 hypothetical protein BSF38_03800 [Paludisphaera borealis]
MIHKPLNILLLVAIASGGFLAWRSGDERGRLTSTYLRLKQITGDFPIEDPSNVHFLALDTGEKLNFAWRVYIPPNYTQVVKLLQGNQNTSWSSSWSSGAVQAIARVRIRENNQGQLMIYTQMPGGSSLMSLGDPALAGFLRDRWNEVRVEQLGTDGVATIAPDKPAVVLRMTLPDSMADEARKKLEPFIVERHVPVLINMQLDPNAPRP